jgi:hypothetical protein
MQPMTSISPVYWLRRSAAMQRTADRLSQDNAKTLQVFKTVLVPQLLATEPLPRAKQLIREHRLMMNAYLGQQKRMAGMAQQLADHYRGNVYLHAMQHVVQAKRQAPVVRSTGYPCQLPSCWG